MFAVVRPLPEGRWLYGMSDEYGLHGDKKNVHFGLLRELNDLNQLFPEKGWCSTNTKFVFPHLEEANAPLPSEDQIEQINIAAKDRNRRMGGFAAILPSVSLSRLNLDKPFQNPIDTHDGYEERLDLIAKYLRESKDDLRADTDVLDILAGLAQEQTSGKFYNRGQKVKIEGLEAILYITIPAPELTRYPSND